VGQLWADDARHLAGVAVKVVHVLNDAMCD
jgi:hypothetical protein